MVKLYVEAHIHKKLRELKSIYSQTKHLVTSYSHDPGEYLNWITKAEQDCHQLVGTIAPGRIVLDTIKLMSFAILNFLAAAWGASSFSDLGLRIISAEVPTRGLKVIVQLIIFTLLALPFLLTFIEATFTTKRYIFLNINLDMKETSSIYQIENKLFNLLNRGKSTEVPVDYLVASLFIPVLLVIFGC